MAWLDLAQNLPFGHTGRCECPSCGIGTGATAAIINHNAKAYTVHCFACDFHDFHSKGILTLAERKRINDLNDEANKQVHKLELPEDTTYTPEDFSRSARTWLFKAGLTPTVWKKYNIGYSKRLERVVLPIYNAAGELIWFQCRAILNGQKPKYIQPSANKSKVLFTANRKESGRVILVEDIMSAIRVAGAVDTTVISLLGTKITPGQADIISTHSRCTLWLDGDTAGKRGSYNIRQTLGLLTDCDNVRTTEDPKFYSNKHIKEILL